MELVLYYLNECRFLLMCFLILIFILGLLAYFSIKNFRQDKKLKVIIYGLFLRMKGIDIFKLTISIVKIFLIFYATIVTDEIIMEICLIMIAMLTVLRMVSDYKGLVYELTCTIIQGIGIYFVYIVNSYMADMEDSTRLMIKICLMMFLLIITVYIFLKDVDKITQESAEKDLI